MSFVATGRATTDTHNANGTFDGIVAEQSAFIATFTYSTDPLDYAEAQFFLDDDGDGALQGYTTGGSDDPFPLAIAVSIEGRTFTGALLASHNQDPACSCC